MIVLHDPATLLHSTVELLGAKVRPALESPQRIEAIVDALKSSSHDFRVIQITAGSHPENLLRLAAQTHKYDYLGHIRDVHDEWVSAGLIDATESVLPECFVIPTVARSVAKKPADIYARAGYYAFDMSTGIMGETFSSAVASANLALQGTEMIKTNNRITSVLALCRPPGHHCDGQRAGGYCYINNAAIAVSSYRENRPNARVGILDIDFHHGNGTQEIFYNDPNVFYTSIHGEDEFPYYTGMADEKGGPDAMGTNLNLPLKPGSSFDQYLAELDKALAALSSFLPNYLVVSLGFDTFHLDPIGHFKIDTEQYTIMAQQIRQRLDFMPAIILLEGGYVLEHLGSNMLAFLKGWEA